MPGRAGDGGGVGGGASGGGGHVCLLVFARAGAQVFSHAACRACYAYVEQLSSNRAHIALRAGAVYGVSGCRMLAGGSGS